MGSSVILPLAGQPKRGPDPGFKSGSVPNLATFSFDRISPPSSVYLQLDDQLMLTVATSLANEVVTINGRILEVPFPRGGQPDAPPTGMPQPDVNASNYVQQFTQALAGVQGQHTQTFILGLTEGYLLGLAATAATATLRGQTFARVTLVRGQSSLQNGRQVLFADYVGQRSVAGWPGGRVVHSSEGPGFLHSRNVANPAAGADWTFQAGIQERVRLVSLNAQLLTSAAAGNRIPQLVLDDGGNVYAQSAGHQVIPANTTAQVTGSQGQETAVTITTDVHVVIPPGHVLAPNHRVRTLTTGILAGDQWSNIWLNVEEWVETT